jgi:uncharacterized membrane protein
MTRTDVVASSRPQTTVGAPSIRRGSPSVSRRLLVLPVALLLAAALVAPTAALAAEGESGSTGYAQKPPTPTTPTTPTTPAATTPATTPTTTTSPTPTSGTSPSKEANTPASGTSPTKTSTSGTSPSSETAKSLPFTGLDLRWTVGVGLLLMGVGFTIVTVQRRQRRDLGS